MGGSCTTTFDKTTTRGKQLVITCTKYYCTMPTRKVYIMKENSVAVNRAKRSVGDKPYALWGGGSATIVSPTEENNGDIILAELQCVPSVVGSRVMNINNVKVVDTSNNKKRRLDQIETLQVEVEGWERRNKKLEEEIAALRAEKDEMAFILEAHRSSCKLQGDVVSEVMVKVEPPTLEANQETEYVQVQVMEPTPLVTSIHKPQRPVSLSLKPAAGGHIEGVPIETPSNGILSFDAIMESRTGLTPTSILTPIKTTSNLNTPTCGSQHKSSLIFTPLFSPNTEATLLTSL